MPTTAVPPVETPVAAAAPRSVLVCDVDLAERLIAEREATGADRLDEVWEGVYVMSPLADNVHQSLGTRLACALQVGLGLDSSAAVYAQVNVSDRDKDWKKNYRCPDAAVYLENTRAVDRVTHWQGGPDFGVEVTSQGDMTRQKLSFYADVGTRELLIVDRGPWQLELYRLEDGRLEQIGVATPGDGQQLTSRAIPFVFAIEAAKPRPTIEVVHAESDQRWTI